MIDDDKFNKIISSRISAIKNGDTEVGPFAIRFGVSRACNFNCITCWHYSPYIKNKKSKDWYQQKINSKVVIKTINQVADMGCYKILFSGYGEPFAHPDMMKFIAQAKDRGMGVRIQTNLSLVRDINKLSRLLNSKDDIVCANMMAASANTYKKMHPNQSRCVYYEVLDNIRYLLKNGVPVRFVYVVNRTNYHEIKKALLLSHRLGTILHLEIMDFEPGGGLDKLALRKSDKQKIIQELEDIRSKDDYSKLRSNIDNFIDQLSYSGLGIKDLDVCYIGCVYSVINELGEVYYCYGGLSNKFLMGDLHKKSFKDIWQSSKYQEQRLRLIQGRFLGECGKCLKTRGYNFKVKYFIIGKSTEKTKAKYTGEIKI